MSVAPVLKILREARAGSRQLDVRIYLALSGRGLTGANARWESVLGRYDIPHYSTAIDAAILTLPADQYDWEFGISAGGGSAIAKSRHGLAASGWQFAPSAALAGCLAGFRILAQQETQGMAA